MGAKTGVAAGYKHKPEDVTKHPHKKVIPRPVWSRDGSGAVVAVMSGQL